MTGVSKELTEGKLTGHDGSAEASIAARAGQVQIVPARGEEGADGGNNGRVVADEVGGAVRGLLDVAPGDIAVATAVGKVSASSLHHQSVRVFQCHERGVISRMGLLAHKGYGTSVPALFPTQTSRSILEGGSISVCLPSELCLRAARTRSSRSTSWSSHRCCSRYRGYCR